MHLDFGGLVKEYAADRCAELCRDIGVRSGVVDLGGDLALIGPHANGEPWIVGIKAPRAEGKAAASIALPRGGLATSGDYERALIIDGKRYSHIVDPRTGWPIESFASVSVVADSCLVAGSASTLAMLLGVERGGAWLRELGLAASLHRRRRPRQRRYKNLIGDARGARAQCAPSCRSNPQQRAAIEYCDGPLLVLAGAGSGKTRVITEKIAHLIARKHLSPNKIAAITFTNKAAREMRERAKRLIKSGADEVAISTFHSLGLKFLQIEHAKLDLKRGFSVIDADDSLTIIKDFVPAGTKPDVLQALRHLVSTAKNNGLSPDEADEAARTAREREAAGIYRGYQTRLKAFNAVDFDDLIRLPLQLLDADADARAAWQERIRYLLVDEYQDTNSAQYRLLRQLAGERGAFTAVGDDDQSIYAWRGANPGNLDELARDYPTLKVIKLEQNYRCSKRILRGANALIKHNPHAHEKKLWSEHAEGGPIRVLACRDDDHEAERIAADIVHQQQVSKAPWSEFAILYRGNHQSRSFEKALRLARVPYAITGGTAFLDRAEVKDVLAYLRLLVNEDDDAAFLRVVNVPQARYRRGDAGEARPARAVEAHLDAARRAQRCGARAVAAARGIGARHVRGADR